MKHQPLASNPLIRPVLFTVHCRIENQDPLWKEISEISVEIGYPAVRGRELWKRVGALVLPHVSLNKSFVNAVWTQDQCDHQVEFDFLPVFKKNARTPTKAYKIKVVLTFQSGARKTFKTKIQLDDYCDQFISVKTGYPSC